MWENQCRNASERQLTAEGKSTVWIISYITSIWADIIHVSGRFEWIAVRSTAHKNAAWIGVFFAIVTTKAWRHVLTQNPWRGLGSCKDVFTYYACRISRTKLWCDNQDDVCVQKMCSSCCLHEKGLFMQATWCFSMQRTVSAWVLLQVRIWVPETEGRTSRRVQHLKMFLKVCACKEKSVCLNSLLCQGVNHHLYAAITRRVVWRYWPKQHGT